MTEREPHTQDPDYHKAKVQAAERRVRVAARELSRLTTPNGHARKTAQYTAALKELLLAAGSYQAVWQAIPREKRP